MRDYKKLTTNDWLNLVNSEADPDIKKYSIDYLKLDDKFAVCINSGYGVFLSELTSSEEDVDKLEEKVLERYNQAKSHGNSFPSLATINPLSTF